MKLPGCVSAVKNGVKDALLWPLFSDASPVVELTPGDLSKTWLPAESWQDLSGAEAAIPDYYNPKPSVAVNWNELLFGGVREVINTYRGEHRGKHRVGPRHSLAIRMELKQPFIPADSFIFREPREGELAATAASVAEVALNTVGLRDVYVGQLRSPSVHQNQPQQPVR